MNKKNILPHQGKPVLRGISGKLPSHLAELSEEALGGTGAEASLLICSYDGAEASLLICSYDGAEASLLICSYDDGDA
jgi:bacteriocin leader peptide (microcyclamide/patellamide family)